MPDDKVWTPNWGAPALRCSEVSGADCDRLVRFGEPSCGLLEHVATWTVRGGSSDPWAIDGQSPFGPGGTDLSFSVADLYVEAPPVETVGSVGPTQLWVTRRVQQGFCKQHNVTAEQALAELRFLVVRAASHGTYALSAGGFHILRWQGYTVVLDPSARRIVGYRTVHFSEVPSQVAQGLRARFVPGLRRHRVRPPADRKGERKESS